MSLLIKGMEMPKIKENKSIKAEIRNLDGRLELGIMTGGYYCCEQWSYYPIIEVPDGHGRLIDADELTSDYFVTSTSTGNYISLYVSKKQIEDAPIIIPADREEVREEPHDIED